MYIAALRIENFRSFNDTLIEFDRDQEGRFPDYSQQLLAFVKPYVGGPD